VQFTGFDAAVKSRDGQKEIVASQPAPPVNVTKTLVFLAV
jgi:hypothetical protein